MITSDIKMAMTSIRSARMRSFMTMTGIIIGVALVLITVSLGEGVRRQVGAQLDQFGPDLITVRPGEPTPNGVSSNLLFNRPGGRLSDTDAEIVAKAQNVRLSTPLTVVSGNLAFEDRTYDQGFIIGAGANLPDLLNQHVEYGGFYSEDEVKDARNVAVIGRDVARELFNEDIPVGKSFTLRGQEFIVRGMFKPFTSNPLSPGGDYNTAVFIPSGTAAKLTNNTAPIFEILAKPSSMNELDTAVGSIKQGLLVNHGGQEDFTILSQAESQSASNNTLTLLGTLTGAIAAVSLLVGGIGVMNIMLVAVTERTHEIGIRKAIGANNRQILGQFVVEAALLSIIGSIIGILIAVLANYVLRAFTDLKPVISWQPIVVVVGLALLAGVIFGVAPAIKAARKDPIEALRHE